MGSNSHPTKQKTFSTIQKALHQQWIATVHGRQQHDKHVEEEKRKRLLASRQSVA